MTRSRIRKQATPLQCRKDRWPAIELSRGDLPAIARHFLALDREDRRLRFGTPSSDDWIRSYLEGIDFGRDSVFGVFDKAWQLVGVVHLGRTPEAVEIGLSVLPAHRNLGIGSSLVERADLRARSWGVRRLIVQFAGDNGAMKHLAAKHGLTLEYDRGDVLGALDLRASAAAVEVHGAQVVETADAVLAGSQEGLGTRIPISARHQGRIIKVKSWPHPT